MISDLVALISLIKELRKLLRTPADGINFSVVKTQNHDLSLPGDHMRIVNLLPIAICACRLWIQQGKDKTTRKFVKCVYHPSTNDEPFGQKVVYRIPLEGTGVFLYPRGMYYVPLSEYPEIAWDGEVWVKFFYSTPDEGEKEGKP